MKEENRKPNPVVAALAVAAAKLTTATPPEQPVPGKKTMNAIDYKLNTTRWQFCTNRHTTTNGHPWGWIENHPNHLCWSDDKRDHRKDTITSKDAHDLVEKHNQWLMDSRSFELKLIDLENERMTASFNAERLKAQLTEAEARLSAIDDKIATLKSKPSTPPSHEPKTN